MSKELYESIKNKLLKRFEPIKPMKDVFKNNRCPRCSHLVDNHYCGECGQKLDWSDEK